MPGCAACRAITEDTLPEMSCVSTFGWSDSRSGVGVLEDVHSA